MSRRPIQLIDASRNVLAVAHVAQEGDRYEGTIELERMPAPLCALFEEFEEVVNGQMFSFLDEIQGKIASLSIKAVLDGNGREVPVRDLQVFPSTGDVSFKLAEVTAPSTRSA
jgi:uncharacterized protein YlaN (UPF0358 family)